MVHRVVRARSDELVTVQHDAAEVRAGVAASVLGGHAHCRIVSGIQSRLLLLVERLDVIHRVVETLLSDPRFSTCDD
jgi:hypothetical protein